MNKKRLVETNILENVQIIENVYKLRLKLPLDYPASIPGQFVNVYLNDASKLLPRPISILDHEDHVMELAYMIMGDGTKDLSKYVSHTAIRISTPLGNGFRLHTKAANEESTYVLIGGGIGIAPLHYTAKYINNNYPTFSLQAILGYKDEPFLNETFEPYCSQVKVCSEANTYTEGSNKGYIKGNVLTPLNDMDIAQEATYLACGPTPMLHAISEYAADHHIKNLQVSVEERMGCGFGTCVGCSIRLRNTNSQNPEDSAIIQKKVCKDGPVFNGNEVIFR